VRRAEEEVHFGSSAEQWQGGGRARYKLELRLFSSLGGLVASGSSPVASRTWALESQFRQAASSLRGSFRAPSLSPLSLFRSGTTPGSPSKMSSWARRPSFAMLVLVLVVQVIATIVAAAAVEPTSLNFEALDDARLEEEDNAIVVEGQYQSRFLNVALLAKVNLFVAFQEFSFRLISFKLIRF